MSEFTPADVVEIGTWAAEECARQHSGEQSCGWMLAGWLHAYEHAAELPTETDILRVAHLVEPRFNDGTSYRRPGITPSGKRISGNVRVGANVKCRWEEVPGRMTRLVAFLYDPKADVDPDEWYRHFEEAHPLADGNGRTGNILWNWLRGTLAHPEVPPDFWSGW